MGAKVSKAKRPKRRWIGLAIPPNVHSKDELKVEIRMSELSEYKIRIYDFHPPKSNIAVSVCEQHRVSNELGIAVICVLHADYTNIREFFESHENQNFISLSSSGKVRLVRERLGLPKPSQT